MIVLRYNKGFTLVELSIVIVIIGLIVAGVVGGQSLVNQAKLRNIVTDINKFNVAINAFILEYNASPGDISNATSYWPGLTNNGNGNKDINCTDTDPEEVALAFQHLSLAGLIPGNFSGDVSGCNSGSTYDLGVDFPEGPIPKSHYRFFDKRSTFSQRGISNYIGFHGYRTNSTTNNTDGILTAKQAFSIDSKIDDGVAYTGRVFGLKERLSWGQNNRCTLLSYGGGASPPWDNPSAVTSDYYLAETIPRCVLSFFINN